MTKHIWLMLLAVTPQLYASNMPLSVSQLITGDSSHVRVTNVSTQAATAWRLVATSVEGARTRREVYTADGYLSEVTHGLPGSSDRLDRIAPGETRELPLDPLPSGASVEVVAVVLDDGTAVGDEQAIATIFERRVKERDALRSVVDVFNEVLASRSGAAALDALRERLMALVQAADSVPCRAALDAVQTYARGTSSEQIEQSLKTYRAFVTREHDLAVKHSRRRPS